MPAAAGHARRKAMEIREALRLGRRVEGNLMVLYVGPGMGAPAGFLSGRRIGGAVARNRVRRLMREAWRLSGSGATAGSKVVFVARPAMVGAKMQDVLGEMRQLLWRARVLGE